MYKQIIIARKDLNTGAPLPHAPLAHRRFSRGSDDLALRSHLVHRHGSSAPGTPQSSQRQPPTPAPRHPALGRQHRPAGTHALSPSRRTRHLPARCHHSPLRRARRALGTASKEKGNIMYLKSASNLNGNLNCSKELEHYAS